MSKKRKQFPVSDHGFGGKAAGPTHQKPKAPEGKDNTLLEPGQFMDREKLFDNE